MTLNRLKLGRAVTFMKYLVSVVPLIFLPETLIWNKTTSPASNLLILVVAVANELMKSVSKNRSHIPFLSDLSLLSSKMLN